MLKSVTAFFASSLLFLSSANESIGAEIQKGESKGMHLEPALRESVPQIAPASDEAELALKRFRLPAGFRASVFAAEPMLANPVAFCLDEQGRVFVSETHRYRSSVLDIRHYMSMLEEDMACRTVDDRLQMTVKKFGTEANQLAYESEIVRLLEDRDGDGVAERSTVYAGGFNSALDGIASGVLAHRGKLWFANIPNIWELSGIDADGHAKSSRIMSHGYGVRYSFTGHDLHGLILGPDGKLYFSFGDRGANVTTLEGKNLAFPDEGAVFRCNPDGTEMEVVHRGLRNPQELAFDEFGNLFTGDNDFDHGDSERWVYVVEGGDSGWRVGYQHAPLGFEAVPWMSERLWVPQFKGQPAYIVPPIANLDDGPSGLVYYPGTGLPAKYNGKFFLCQFKGNISKSGIRTFSLKPSGAGFELVDSEQFLWNVQATDVDFGPDSQLYFSDWGEGWQKTAKGRIYRVVDTNSIDQAIVRETEKLIAKNFTKFSQRELLNLLSHPNMRVRLEAQYVLAERGSKSVAALGDVAKNSGKSPLARRHSIWALGQIARKNTSALKSAVPLLADADPEIRAQSAKIFGEAPASDLVSHLTPLLRDSSLRVQFFAAQSLGKLGRKEAVAPLLEMVRENQNRDVYLRHAGAIALSRCAELPQLMTAARDKSPAVRMAVLLAMRQLARPEIAAFLNDSNELLVSEAARAINDVPINEAMPQLAARLNSSQTFSTNRASHLQAFQVRAVNANLRLGTATNAEALAQFVSSENANAVAAVEAVNNLGIWAEPGERDRVVGTYRPITGERNRAAAVAAFQPIAAKLITGKHPEKLKLAAIHTARKLELTEASEPLFQLVSGQEESEKVRLEALKTLGEWKGTLLSDAVKLAQADASELIRKEANRLATELKPDTALLQITSVLENGSIPEKQGALTSLALLSGGDLILLKQLEAFRAKHLPRELELELFEAIAAHPSPTLKAQAQKYLGKSTDPLARFQQTLFGGNAEAGKKIFLERPEASCARCHKINNEGGDVGPVLNGIGAQKSREYLLQSLVQPNAQIAPGYETLLVVMKNGASYAGVFKNEDDKELVINSPEDGIVKIAKQDIQSRNRGSSGMPEGLAEVLSKREIRDLVEFLATTK